MAKKKATKATTTDNPRVAAGMTSDDSEPLSDAEIRAFRHMPHFNDRVGGVVRAREARTGKPLDILALETREMMHPDQLPALGDLALVLEHVTNRNEIERLKQLDYRPGAWRIYEEALSEAEERDVLEDPGPRPHQGNDRIVLSGDRDLTENPIEASSHTGPDWDVEAARKRAVKRAEEEIKEEEKRAKETEAEEGEVVEVEHVKA